MNDINREQEAHEYANANPGALAITQPTEAAINNIVALVQEGEVNGLDAFAAFKKLEKLFDEAKKAIEVYAQSEADKWGEKTFKFHNIEFSKRQGYAQYDFEHDVVYHHLKHQLKQREELLKLALKSDQPIYDHEGVEVQKVPINGYTKDSLTVKF
jgi:hypothetical protein